MKKKNIKPKRDTYIRVLKLIVPYHFFVVLSIVTVAVSVLGQLYIPILAGRAIDYMIGIGKVDFIGVKGIILTIVAVAGLAAIGQWLSGICNNHITYNVSRKLRNMAIEKIQTLPLAY
ncbi:MAG: ABC transporter transmembrane domain-containing protein, partial [Pygmaiobacter massiliensis]